MGYYRSFLVSCVGAYDDSGVGTGGLVCICEGDAVVIDKMDCTGLWQQGDTVYRFVRSVRSIIGYGESGIKFLLKLPDTKDVHDIAVVDGDFICVSTGKNEIQWYDPFGKLVGRWKAEGEGDAWHLNCLCRVGNRLFVSAFGEFAEHRGWNTKGCANQGFILEVSDSTKVVDGLSGPHSPRYIDERWVVCESHRQMVSVWAEDGSVDRVQLDGFTRGLAYDDTYLYVGESASRKEATVSDCSFISVINRRSLQLVARIKVPLPEIYEILLLSPDLASRMIVQKDLFTLDYTSRRVEFLEQQSARLRVEIETLKKTLCGQRRSIWKRRIKRLVSSFRQ